MLRPQMLGTAGVRLVGEAGCGWGDWRPWGGEEAMEPLRQGCPGTFLPQPSHLRVKGLWPHSPSWKRGSRSLICLPKAAGFLPRRADLRLLLLLWSEEPVRSWTGG